MATRRRTRDRLLGWLVRSTSVLVFLLLGGMFVQMAMVAWPLLQGLKLTEQSHAVYELTDVEQVPQIGPQTTTRPATPEAPRPEQFALLSAEEAARQVAVEEGDNHCTTPAASGVTAVQRLPNQQGCLRLYSSGEYRVASINKVRGNAAVFGAPLPVHQAARSVPGGQSWLLIDGQKLHWVHLVNTPQGPVLERIRSHRFDNRIAHVSEVNAERTVAITDTHGNLWLWPLLAGAPERLADTPAEVAWAEWEGAREILMVLRSGETRHFKLLGWQWQALSARLFAPLQYEGYVSPQRVWQPSAPASGQVPKFNLMPLFAGTLEAALLALVLAVPVALFAAVYVGFFLPRRRRQQIKPIIEMIASFPTVVLGGLAAIWLAPMVVHHLPQVVGALLAVPCAALAVLLLPGGAFRGRSNLLLQPFRLSMLLLPSALLCLWAGIHLGSLAEQVWFNGSWEAWRVAQDIAVSQFNGVIVGLVLGLAVLPVIFTLAEDAINECPREAALGSQALGASPWQSFRDVVLPIAAPALVSAVMLGLGRAVGETMVFLMLSGNAPALNINPLDAMRSMGATLVIELPEAAVGGLHFRILFLSALLLFATTFVLNSIAQFLRQRQRARALDQN